MLTHWSRVILVQIRGCCQTEVTILYPTPFPHLDTRAELQGHPAQMVEAGNGILFPSCKTICWRDDSIWWERWENLPPLFVRVYSDLVLIPVSSVCLGDFSSPGAATQDKRKKSSLSVARSGLTWDSPSPAPHPNINTSYARAGERGFFLAIATSLECLSTVYDTISIIGCGGQTWAANFGSYIPKRWKQRETSTRALSHWKGLGEGQFGNHGKHLPFVPRTCVTMVRQMC